MLKFLKDFLILEFSELCRKYDIGDDSRDWCLDNVIKEVKVNVNNLEEYIVLC